VTWRLQKYRSIYKWQYLYLPPLYGILGIKNRFQDFLETFLAYVPCALRVAL
jgi:hypothetical protein